ncbi:MAG TPA: hypothetical protein VGM03_04120 [Phycisphaerae bacterium]|jgi:hypothetical protein
MTEPNPAYHLDIADVDESAPADPRNGAHPRRWIGVQFECCHVYARVYRNAAGTAYEGHCPRCAAALRIAIGPNGTPERFFRAAR